MCFFYSELLIYYCSGFDLDDQTVGIMCHPIFLLWGGVCLHPIDVTCVLGAYTLQPFAAFVHS